jgi:alpha-glucosidase
MLGEDILVAPVLVEGALERDVYLPKGKWEARDGTLYDGPQWLLGYPAPLNTLPFFLMMKE